VPFVPPLQISKGNWAVFPHVRFGHYHCNNGQIFTDWPQLFYWVDMKRRGRKDGVSDVALRCVTYV